MIEGIVALASFGIVGGGTFGNLLYQLQNLGLFSYILPFLMIFAIVYAILSNTHLLGDNMGVHLTLSIGVGLLSLQFNFVSYFFAQIFPRLGILLIIIFILILVLSFFPDQPWTKYLMGGLGLIGVAMIVIQSFSNTFFGWSSWGIFNGQFSFLLQEYGPKWIVIGFFILVFAAIIIGGRHRRGNNQNNQRPGYP